MNLISQKRNTFQVDIRKKAKEQCFKAKRIQINMSTDCDVAFQQFLKNNTKRQIPQICAQNYEMVSPALIDIFLREYAIQFQKNVQIGKVSNISFLTKISLQKMINFSTFFKRAIRYCVEILKVIDRAAFLQKCCRQSYQFVQQTIHQDVYFNCMMEYFGSCFILGLEYEFQQIQIIVDSLYVWAFNEQPSLNLNYFSFCFLYRSLINLLKLKGQMKSSLSLKIQLIGEVFVINCLDKGYLSLQYLRIIQALLRQANYEQNNKFKFVKKLFQQKNFRELIKVGIFCNEYVYNKKKYQSKKFQNLNYSDSDLKLSIQKSIQRNLYIEQQVQQIQQSVFSIFELLPQIKYDFFPIQLVDQLIHEIVEFIYKKNKYETNAIIILYNIMLGLFHDGQQYFEETADIIKVKQMLQSFFKFQFQYQKLIKEENQQLISLKFDLLVLILQHFSDQRMFKKIIFQGKLLQKLLCAIKMEDKIEFGINNIIEEKEESSLNNKIQILIQIIFQNRDILSQSRAEWNSLMEQLLCLQIRQMQITKQTKRKYRLLLQQLTMSHFKQ